jgi:hypothetical protein
VRYHRVVFEGVRRHVLAVAGVPEAAVWHLGDPADVVVDPDRTEPQCPRRPEGPAHVPGPHRGGEPVGHIVGPAQRLFVVLEALDGDNGPEDFFLDDLAPLLRAGDKRRLDEETAAAVRPGAAGEYLYTAARLRPLQEAQYALPLGRGDNRAHLDVLALRRVGGLD